MADDEATTGGVSDEERFKQYRAATDKIRSNADVAAKALGAIGTAALTAVGLDKFGSVFPATGGWWIPAVAAYVVTAYIVGVFTLRLWRINQPIVLSSDPRRMELKDDDEKAMVDEVYTDTSRLRGYKTLAAYVGRAETLSKVADRADAAGEPERAKEARGASSRILSEVQTTEARAGTILVRQRAQRALTDPRAKISYAFFIAAVVMFAYSSGEAAEARVTVDELQACAEARSAGATGLPAECTAPEHATASVEESRIIAFAKSCAEARTAGAAGLPKACDSYKSDQQAAAPTPGALVDDAYTALAQSRETCRAAAAKAEGGEAECGKITAALQALE